jgi:hypothetical protein
MNPGGVRGRSFARAARGPVLIIVVGALFAMDHAGGASIGRTWPVILVAAGAMRLWEYLGARQQ